MLNSKIIELHETIFNGYYVTIGGDVYSLKGDKPILCLKLGDNGSGYKYVNIKNNKPVYIHRLMASTFLGLDLNDRHIQVNHLDGDPNNNALYNLQLCNAKENIRHAQRLKIMRKACSWLYMCK